MPATPSAVHRSVFPVPGPPINTALCAASVNDRSASWSISCVVMGGVVKANGRANLRVTTFLRDARGLLVDRSDDVVRAGATDVDLLPALKAAIARAAAEGQPYTKTGGNGVYERRHELPEAFHAIGKHRLADWVGTLLDREELVMAMARAPSWSSGWTCLAVPSPAGRRCSSPGTWAAPVSGGTMAIERSRLPGGLSLKRG